VIGVAPLHVPSEAVSVEPTCVVLLIVGGAVLTGGEACSAACPLRVASEHRSDQERCDGK